MEVKFRNTPSGTAASSEAAASFGADMEPLAVVADRWVRVHPTRETMAFREMLMGVFGYTEGQGVYNVVRSSDAATRQLQAAVFAVLLNATAYRDLEADWRDHVSARRLDPDALARRYGAAADSDAAGVASRVFETWQRTLQTTLMEFAHGLASCFSLGGPGCPISFSKYIDWIVCLGMVPVSRRARPTNGMAKRLAAYLDGHALPHHMATVAGIAKRAAPTLFEIARAMDSSCIAEYDRVQVFYNFRRGEWRTRDALTGLAGECVVLWPPLWSDGKVVFDSPMQRISHEVRACYALREHAHLCRLLNTAPVKVLLGRRPEAERGAACAARAVDRALGEDAEGKAGSAAARLVRLIINMKGMRHVGDINDTVRAYLDETGGHLIDGAQVNQTLPGFGKAGRAGGAPSQPQQLQQAFQTSIVSGINNVLEGYINNLFGTIERLRESNSDLSSRLEARERELGRSRASALRAEQRAADEPGPSPGYDPRIDCDVIDISNRMGDDAYVANSFQRQYVPSYAQDLERLSKLWEHELVRCFKISRNTNNQGQETAIHYSSGAVSMFVRPYFAAVLKAPHVGTPIGGIGAAMGEEELWEAVFRKTRLQTYLADLVALFVADVQHAAARRALPEKSQRGQRSRSPPSVRTVSERARLDGERSSRKHGLRDAPRGRRAGDGFA
ncbi:capsid portal protein [Bovine alphaherpesvirus 2]|uniref:Capsid portal protein n=1 Tax=Bovine alphaherpesvirus 2 TaxID=10295 RepID=A0A7T1L7I9_9ALPH|nr:capsid portal protein [Bovine alphaherpesvirus 2]